MLVLSRSEMETVVVGDDITITILSIKQNQVRVGIQAPTHISIHRKEVYLKIKEKKYQEEIPQQVA